MTLEAGGRVEPTAAPIGVVLGDDVERELHRLIRSIPHGGEVTQGNLIEMIRHTELSEPLIAELVRRIKEAGLVFVEDAKSEASARHDEEAKTRRPSRELDRRTSGRRTASSSDDAIQAYLSEIGHVPLLDGTEEFDLATTYEAGQAAAERLARHEAAVAGDGPASDAVSARQVRNLRQLMRQGDAAKDRLIEANLRLVVSIAKRHRNRGVAFLDLIQEGNLGLMRAVEKFDPHKGFKFSTYATWWIRQAITRAIADQARTIRIPVHLVETINTVVATQRQMTQDLCREVGPDEIAAHLGMEPDKVRELLRLNQDTISLEQPMGDDDDFMLSDTIQDHGMASPDATAAKHLLHDAIREVLGQLDEREREVVSLRFGLEDGKVATLYEVGRHFGITRERVRQIEVKTIAKLRRPERSIQLRGFLDGEE